MAARQYFSVLKKECQKHKEIQPMSNYIRQYIGYREHGKKFICIRFFNYIKEINGLQVNMSYTVVYMGKNDHHYGYMIYDCDDKRVVKFEYHE
ncbi:MAG: hypothetical protein K5854_05785 [Prevotella sp.]|nr:hypothetical protein [Prevotella sp.]